VPFAVVECVCLSEVVQTLWFEDVGFVNEQMLDTPVGRFSIRQMGIFLVFGLLAWGVSLLLEDVIFKVVVGGAVFFAGAFVFTRKVKTISPEVHLLYIIGIRRTLHTKQKAHKRQEQQKPPKLTSPAKSVMLSATLGVPVKIVGALKDPALGKPLSGRSFELSIDGAAYSKGFTDEEGFFCAYFVPDHFGVFKIEVKPEGFTTSTQQIIVNVNSKEVIETAEAKAQT